MTARSTFEATNAPSAVPTSAGATRVASNVANANTHQETISANASSGFGTSLARGVTAAQDVTIRAANATYVANKQRAAMIEQTTIDNAKATLRNTGDTGIV